MHEYTSEVFSVGIAGFAPVDNDKITAMAEDGWEPALMTTVHNGFAALVLFRREGTGQRRRRVLPTKRAAPAARATSKAPAPAAKRPAKARPAATARKARTR